MKLDVEDRKIRRKQWRSITTTAAHALEGETVDTTDAFQRRGWQAWYAPTFLAALLAMVGVIGYLVKRQHMAGAAADPNMVLQTSLQKTGKEILTPISGTVVEPPSKEWGEKARQVSEDFLKATTLEAILPLVRNPTQFKAEIQTFASQPGHLPIGPNGVMNIVYAPEETAGKTGTLAMLFFENNQQTLQGLVLAETPEGLLVDWPSYSGMGEMTIQEFLTKKPTEPTLLRVAARLDDYYNFEFADRNLVTCLRLTDYPETIYCFGYVVHETGMKNKVKHLPTQDHNVPDSLQTKPQPLTIKARFHSGTQSENQVEITEVLGNGWFVR